MPESYQYCRKKGQLFSSALRIMRQAEERRSSRTCHFSWDRQFVGSCFVYFWWQEQVIVAVVGHDA